MAAKNLLKNLKSIGGVIIVILVVLGLGLGGWFIAKKIKGPSDPQDNQTSSPQALTAQEIQDIFRQVPPGAADSPPIAQSGNPQVSTPPAPSAPPGSSPRGEVAGTATVREPYRNTVVAIELALPTNWSVRQSANNTLEFLNPSGAMVSWIEIITPPPASNDDLLRQLRQSPAVSNLQSASVGGKSGWKFSLNRWPGQALAVIANGKLYYIFGELVASPVLPSLKFLQ